MRTLTLAAAALVAAGLACAQPARRVPGFSLSDINGQFHDPQDYRGKILLLEIMRTDCAPCRPFSKILEQVKTHYGGKVAILSITNPPDKQSTVAQFVAEEKVTYPILLDCGQVAFSLVRPSPLRPSISIPHVYLVDGEGHLRKDFEYGPTTTELFQGSGLYKEIDALLKK